MEILIAKTAGFCFGVKRAINLAEEHSSTGEGDIYTLGPIIHNPQVVDKLEEKSVYAKDDIDHIDDGTVIIRSHGVKLSEIEAAGIKGLKVVDATCPFVKKTHEYVNELSGDGYTVIVVGDKEHPEVQGIISYATTDVRVVTDPEELVDMARVKKVGIVAQTTQSIRNLEAVTSFCLSKAAEVKVYNTICNATSMRQSESVEIANRAGLMIVVGGRNSANTMRLAEICKEIQPKTFHIEVASEMEEGWFEGVECVGITAGASTPSWVINEVVERAREMGQG